MRRLISRLFPPSPADEFVAQCDEVDMAMHLTLELTRMRMREMMQAELRQQFEEECG